MDKKREVWIDEIKGFAIFCVVFGHALLNLVNSGTEKFSVNLVCNIVYAFHMPLFMMISGYLYRKAYFTDQGEPNGKRMKRQILNIIIVYLVYSLLLGISKLPFGKYVNGPSSIADILLIPVKPFQLYWYLYTLVVLYLVFLLKVFRGKHALLISAFLCAISQLIEVNYFAVKSTFYYVLFFCIGVKLCEYGTNRLRDCKAFCWMGGGISIALLIAFARNKEMYANIPGINAIIGVSFSLLLIFIFARTGDHNFNKHKIMVYLGKHSMEIYLVHTYFVTVSKIVLNKFVGQYEWIEIFLMTACGLVGGILVGEGCSRIKISHIVFQPITLLEKKIEI